MGRKSIEMNIDMREQIHVITSYEESNNISELAGIFSIPRTIIGSVIKDFNQTGSVENRSWRGRKIIFGCDSTELSRVVKKP